MKNDIRFLLTNNCNYDCYFCHNEGEEKKTCKNELKVDDYILLYSVYSEKEGWNGVTLSGGEPLIYNRIDELVKKLSNIGAKITIVTNGYFLNKHLPMLKFVKRINVSIHTLNKTIYEKITGRTNTLCTVKENLSMVRDLYPKLEIRLNVTPCKDNGWNINFLKELIEYSKKINASIKFTELFPNTDPSTVTLKEIIDQLYIIGYEEVPIENRTRLFRKDKESIYLTQCTCSKALQSKLPIDYCRENHDLYVNHDGTIPLCRLGQEYIDITKELKDKNTILLKKKIEIAKLRVTKDVCYMHLKGIQ